MKLTIKLFLLIIIAASTIFADGDMNNGGYTCEGDMNNGGRICAVDCSESSPDPENNCEESRQTSEQTDDDEDILTVIENYLKLLFG